MATVVHDLEKVKAYCQTKIEFIRRVGELRDNGSDHHGFGQEEQMTGKLHGESRDEAREKLESLGFVAEEGKSNWFWHSGIAGMTAKLFYWGNPGTGNWLCFIELEPQAVVLNISELSKLAVEELNEIAQGKCVQYTVTHAFRYRVTHVLVSPKLVVRQYPSGERLATDTRFSWVVDRGSLLKALEHLKWKECNWPGVGYMEPRGFLWWRRTHGEVYTELCEKISPIRGTGADAPFLPRQSR